jgi:hypothetical protein
MQQSAVQADLAAPASHRATSAPEPSKEPASPTVDAPRPGAPDPAPEADELDPAAPAAAAEPAVAEPAPESEADKALAAELSKGGKKVSPWKLVRQFKEQLATAEKEALDFRTRLSAAAKAEEAVKRAEAIEKRNAELEEHIRYVDYSKSQEFAEKYQRPYEEAWASAVQELAELDVLAEDGTVARKATPQDLLALANLPLGEARRQANAMFGDSADDVMAHRRKVQELSRAQAKALDDARKSGSERTEKSAAQQQAIVKEVSDTWTKLNADIAAKSEFLRAKEGDEEWNGKLTAAQKLADEAFSVNATDPRLTPEQRAEVVKKHVAMRARAVAYSAQKLHIARLTKQLAAVQAELAQFKNSGTVNGDGQNGTQTPAQAATPMERALQRMQQGAVPLPGRFM